MGDLAAAFGLEELSELAAMPGLVDLNPIHELLRGLQSQVHLRA
jgi:hypothetical protein